MWWQHFDSYKCYTENNTNGLIYIGRNCKIWFGYIEEQRNSQGIFVNNFLLETVKFTSWRIDSK